MGLRGEPRESAPTWESRNPYPPLLRTTFWLGPGPHVHRLSSRPASGSWHDRTVILNGRGRRRQEGAGKVDGSTRFTGDLEMAGLLHVQLVLSHLPSARIVGIETAAARSAPGVVAVVTGADLPEVEAAG